MASIGSFRSRHQRSRAGGLPSEDRFRPKIEIVPLPLVQPQVRDRAAGLGAESARLLHIPRPLALWHLASLDAPTVAVIWALGFAWAAQIHAAGRVLLVLALTAWCAYVGDRLLDARAGLGSAAEAALRERHLFHWRHRRLMTPLAVVAACVAGAMAASLVSPPVRERGLVLGAAALVYLMGVHGASRLQRRGRSLPRLLNKEVLVAALFTAGCVLPAWTRLDSSAARGALGWWFLISAVYFAALAWLNCSSIARWEENDDHCGGEGGSSVARMRQPMQPFAGVAVRALWVRALLLAFAGVVLAIVAFKSFPRVAALLAAGAVSGLLLALLDRGRMRMTPLAVRTTADLVLLTPLLLLLR